MMQVSRCRSAKLDENIESEEITVLTTSSGKLQQKFRQYRASDGKTFV